MSEHGVMPDEKCCDGCVARAGVHVVAKLPEDHAVESVEEVFGRNVDVVGSLLRQNNVACNEVQTSSQDLSKVSGSRS